MKGLCTDTSCCTITYTEAHILQASQYTRAEYIWQTKMDTYIQCKTYAGQIYEDYAGFLLAGANRTKPHAGFPKDDSMKLYKLLRTMVEGAGNKK